MFKKDRTFMKYLILYKTISISSNFIRFVSNVKLKSLDKNLYIFFIKKLIR